VPTRAPSLLSDAAVKITWFATRMFRGMPKFMGVCKSWDPREGDDRAWQGLLLARCATGSCLDDNFVGLHTLLSRNGNERHLLTLLQ
jgi:hypothetical protein